MTRVITHHNHPKIGHPKRLLDLAEMLETMILPKKAKFHMDVFGRHEKTHAPVEAGYCGTTACAMGWAALNPKFNHMGLHMVWKKDWNGAKRGTVVFRGAKDFAAAEKFFGINKEAAEYLFYPEEYSQTNVASITRKYVVKRIRKFVETGKYTVYQWLVDGEEE